jgi:hypothetical protein
VSHSLLTKLIFLKNAPPSTGGLLKSPAEIRPHEIKQKFPALGLVDSPTEKWSIECYDKEGNSLLVEAIIWSKV